MKKALLAVGVALAALTAEGQANPPPAAPRAPTQTDEYTRYELLAPETAQFRIVYEVTATTPGATLLLQPDPQGQRRDRRVGAATARPASR